MGSKKIVNLNTEYDGKWLKRTQDDSHDKEGSNNMKYNEFITQKDLDNLEEKIDLKMENIQAKMDAEFRSINSKIDNLPTIFENMLLKNEKEQEIKRKETNRYIWGTLILGTIGVIISVASLLL